MTPRPPNSRPNSKEAAALSADRRTREAYALRLLGRKLPPAQIASASGLSITEVLRLAVKNAHIFTPGEAV